MTLSEKFFAAVLVLVSVPACVTVFRSEPQTTFVTNGDVDDDGLPDEADEHVRLRDLGGDLKDSVGISVATLPKEGVMVEDPKYITLNGQRFLAFDLSSEDGIAKFSAVKRAMRKPRPVAAPAPSNDLGAGMNGDDRFSLTLDIANGKASPVSIP